MLNPDLIDIKEPPLCEMWAQCAAASFYDQLAEGQSAPVLDEDLQESMPSKRAFERLNELGVAINVRPGHGVLLLSLIHDQ